MNHLLHNMYYQHHFLFKAPHRCLRKYGTYMTLRQKLEDICCEYRNHSEGEFDAFILLYADMIEYFDYFIGDFEGISKLRYFTDRSFGNEASLFYAEIIERICVILEEADLDREINLENIQALNNILSNNHFFLRKENSYHEGFRAIMELLALILSISWIMFLIISGAMDTIFMLAPIALVIFFSALIIGLLLMGYELYKNKHVIELSESVKSIPRKMIAHIDTLQDVKDRFELTA